MSICTCLPSCPPETHCSCPVAVADCRPDSPLLVKIINYFLFSASVQPPFHFDRPCRVGPKFDILFH